MTSPAGEPEPQSGGYYLIYIPRESFAPTQQALASAGISIDYSNYAELGDHQETHCTINMFENVISESLNEQLQEEGLTLKRNMSWEELRDAAELYANDSNWTSGHEVLAETFRSKMPHLVETAPERAPAHPEDPEPDEETA